MTATASLTPIPFAPTGDTLWAAADAEVTAYVAVRPLCANLGITWHSQWMRIQRSPILSKGVLMMRTPSKGGMQEMVCLPLKLIPGFLMGIDLNRVHEAAKPKLVAYQAEAYDVLWAYFSGRATQAAAGVAQEPGIERDGCNTHTFAAPVPDLSAREISAWVEFCREARLVYGRQHAHTIWLRTPLARFLGDDLGLPRPNVLAEHIRSFLDSCTEAAPDGRVSAAAIYRAYQAWCAEQGCEAMSQRRFGLALGEMGRHKFRSNGVYYAGVRMKGAASGAENVQ